MKAWNLTLHPRMVIAPGKVNISQPCAICMMDRDLGGSWGDIWYKQQWKSPVGQANNLLLTQELETSSYLQGGGWWGTPHGSVVWIIFRKMRSLNEAFARGHLAMLSGGNSTWQSLPRLQWASLLKINMGKGFCCWVFADSRHSSQSPEESFQQARWEFSKPRIRQGAVFDSDTSVALIVADEELFPLPRSFQPVWWGLMKEVWAGKSYLSWKSCKVLMTVRLGCLTAFTPDARYLVLHLPVSELQPRIS